MVRGKPLDFRAWESVEQVPLYAAQPPAVRPWLRGRVLDVACNYGRFSRLTESAVSMDVEERFLRRGMQLGTIRRPVVGSALSLPFLDRSFETVLAMGIIDHIPHAQIPRFLDELVRVARPDGSVIVQVTSPYSVWALRKFETYDDYVHPYSPLKLRRQLLRRGWRQSGVFSSGLTGTFTYLPRTTGAFLVWAIHITIRFTKASS